jgi:NIPSNAP
MTVVYEYRAIRVPRAGWRDVSRSVYGGTSEAVRAAGGLVIGMFAGLIGFATDEGVVLSAWTDPDAQVSHAPRTVGAVASIIESSAERLAATVRPIDAAPLPAGAPGDVYAHRWFWLQPQDWPEFLTLSEEGVWPFFESDGCRIIGLWRSMEPGPLAKALLITRYPSVAHWERTRLQAPEPPPGADARLYRAAQDAGRRRAQLTERSIVRLTRLLAPDS